MVRRGPLNKLKLIGIKGGQNGKKPISSWSFTRRRGRREGIKREALTYLQDLRSSDGRLASGQDLKSEYSSRAARGDQNQEFSSEIRAESSGGHGFRASRSSKSFVFAQRGNESSYSSLFSI